MTLQSEQIRILHIITGLSTGGAEMMMAKLLSATHQRCCQVVVSLKDEGTLGAQVKELGVPVHTLRLRPALPSPFRLFHLLSIIRQFRPDLIQGWMHHGNVIASFASRFSPHHPPVVWDVQQSIRRVSDFGPLTAMVIRLGAIISRSPAKIVYVSQTGAKQHDALGYHAETRVIIPNGVDCETFHPNEEARRQVRAELGIAPEQILVGLVARYHAMKDHTGFLTAAAQLVHRYRQIRFLLVGEGVTMGQPALYKLISQHHLQDNVFLLGERHDTPRLTPALDIACSASAWGEAFSVAIGEAMACGVPCVVTDVGDNAFLVGDTGLSIPPGNPEVLAQAIGQLVDAGLQRRRELGAAARRRMETEFSLPVIAAQYEQLYQEVALKRRATAGISAGASRARSIQRPEEKSQQLPDTGISKHHTLPAVESAETTRILHVITDLSTGGTEMMLLKLLSSTCQRYRHVVVSVKDEGTIGPRIGDLGIPVHSLGIHPTVFNPFRVISIKPIVREFRPHLIQGWLYLGNLMASLAGNFLGNGVPVLWNIRQSLDDMGAYRWTTSAVLRVGAFLSQRPTALIYNSMNGARDHEAFGFHNKKEVLIPNGFDCDVFRPDALARKQIRDELGVGNGTLLVGLVARYDPIKDHQNFFQAAGLVARTHPDVRFVLVGKGLTSTHPKVMRAIVTEGLSGKVFLLGERLDVERVTCAFDVACSASWSEGFSNTVGEAMACGVACVVTDVGDSAYLVGDTGLVVPPRAPELLAEALSKLIDAGPDYRHHSGDAARKRIQAEFSLAAIIHRYADLYGESIMRSKNQEPRVLDLR